MEQNRKEGRVSPSTVEYVNRLFIAGWKEAWLLLCLAMNELFRSGVSLELINKRSTKYELLHEHPWTSHPISGYYANTNRHVSLFITILPVFSFYWDSEDGLFTKLVSAL